MLKKLAIFLISLLLLGILFSKMFLIQVRYDEVVIIERFQNVKAPHTEAGVKFRWPWPIDQVDRYSKRLKVLHGTTDERSTQDGRQVILKCYLVWQIKDASTFHQAFNGESDAEQKLRLRIREVSSVIGSYDFDELVNVDATKLKLNEIEAEILQKMQASFDEGGYGISAEKVGVYRINLPESSTKKIFDSMVSIQEDRAKIVRTRGESQSVTIRANTDQAKQQILDLAQRVASDIRAEGDKDSAKVFELYAKDQEFAVFLQEVATLQQILDKNTTFVLTPKDLSFLKWLQNDAQAIKEIQKNPEVSEETE